MNTDDKNNLEKTKKYIQHSHESYIQGDFDSAITDLTKSIYLMQQEGEQDPLSQLYSYCKDRAKMMVVAYVRRGQLYARKEMYLHSISDYKQAISEYAAYETSKKTKYQEKTTNQKQNQQYKACEQFISNSVCANNIQAIQNVAQIYEQSVSKTVQIDMNTEHKQDNRFKQLLASLLEQQESQKEQQQQQLVQLLKMKDQQIAQMKQMMEKQYQQLQEMNKKMQEKLEKKLQKQICQITDRNYQVIFYREIQTSTMNISNKQKCQIYFRNFVMQMEKYYLAAKVLGQFSENSKIKFEDYWLANIGLVKPAENMTPIKNVQTKNKYCFTKDLVAKLFKVMDKNSSKLDKASDIVKQLPYIGTAFKIIKSAVKGFGWFQSIQTENQCQHILMIRSNLTSFNEFSMHLAYDFYRLNRIKITMTNMEPYKRSAWQRMSMKYRKFRRSVLGEKLFPNVKQEEYEYIKSIAEMHVSIFMMGISYGHFGVSPGRYYSQQRVQQIVGIIQQIQNKLLALQYLEDQNEQKDIMVSVYDSEQLMIELQANQKANEENKQKSKCRIY